MAGLPRSIIKQYGVSKKAWAVYRSRKRGRSTRRKRRRVKTMARRSYRRYYPRRRYRRRSSGGFGIGRLLSKKNLMYTIGGVLVGSYMGFNPKVAAGIGGLAGAGLGGGVAGYLSGDTIARFISGFTGGGNGAVMY